MKTAVKPARIHNGHGEMTLDSHTQAPGIQCWPGEGLPQASICAEKRAKIFGTAFRMRESALES
jgi:hypothetical protein